MQVYEEFILLLIREGLIKDCTGDKDKIREYYNNEFRSKGNCAFSYFFRCLWRHWYIIQHTKKTAYFDDRWITYFTQKEKNKTAPKKIPEEEQVEEDIYEDKKICKLCAVKCSSKIKFKIHKESLKHKVRIQYLKNKCSLNRSRKMRLQIIEVNNITYNSDDARSSSLSMKVESKTNLNATLHLINDADQAISIIELIQVNAHTSDLTLITTLENTPVNLKPGENSVVVLNGYFENSSSFVFPLVIVGKYVDKPNTERFLKEITVEVISEFSDLKSNIPYTQVKRNKRFNDFDTITPGSRPLQYDSFYYEKFPLENFEIPVTLDVNLKNLMREYRTFIQRSNSSPTKHILHEQFAKILKIDSSLCETNYCTLLETLVNIEENQMKIDIRDFDVESVLTSRSRIEYVLQVPGLAEARPSLMMYDSVYVKTEKNAPRKFQGIVHEVLDSAVVLGFDRSFSYVFIPNKKFHIEFGFNRRPLRVEKQAIWLAQEHNIASYFYPKQESDIIHIQDAEPISYFNPILNEEQKKAIKNILHQKSAPYLIFGPPGTGKTVTIVEAILQIWKNNPDAKMLVCSPSNSSTNEIALRLVDEVPSTDLIRLLGKIYGKDAKLSKLENFVNIDADGSYYMPSIDDILNYKIVLTTLVTAARLVNGGVPDGHYSHVFIDESGYATESQTLIAISGILSSSENKGKVNGQIILAGDPMQLGPVVHSKFAEDCGYGTSMLERLINTCDLYARNENNPVPYNEKYVTKLVKNYRSHKAILKTSNELFYHNELVPAGNELCDTFTDWEHLPAPGFPVIFHHVMGEDTREESSPSYFNIQEIEEVADYVSRLLDGTLVKGLLINQDHIGIISPYKKQVEMLRKACKKKQWNDILVGSVEQFQGKEKLITIITTVRSKNTNKFEEVDKKCQLGFIRNPKRFNVAITRAKALLIVVGNGLVLKGDKNWLNLIQYCVDNKSIAGRPFSLSDNELLTEEIPLGSSNGREENDC